MSATLNKNSSLLNKNMNALFFKFFLINFIILSAQSYTAESFGFKSYSLNDETLGKVNYYVSLNTIEKEKPLLVFFRWV